LGQDLKYDGLKGTPDRVARAWEEMLGGYQVDVAKLLATDFMGEGYDELVVLNGVEFTSVCEHHLLPFIGTASIAYLPRDRVVGLSKLARVVDAYARRLQIQERMTMQIANAIEMHTQCGGVAVVVRARHQCMCARGVRRPGAVMVTSRMSGCFREKPEARAEVMALFREGSP
jgi:GTP cyclohydrolase I